MAQVLIRAVTNVNAANENGTLTTYHKGDWFKIGKQRAIELLESGQAEMPEEVQAQRAMAQDLEGCGIYLRAGTVRDAKHALAGLKVDIAEFSGAIRLPYERTLIWHHRLPLDRKQIALGFERIRDTGRYASWEVAAMLRQNDLLASQIGDKADHRRTLARVGDLRLPVYETGAVWVRQTTDTTAMVAEWDRQSRDSECVEHAFLRALYTPPPVLLCSLPAGWLGRWRRS